MATHEPDRTIAIEANGRALAVPAGASVLDVARTLGVAEGERGVAVALDGAVVPRATWAQTPVRASQRLEVVRATAGG